MTRPTRRYSLAVESLTIRAMPSSVAMVSTLDVPIPIGPVSPILIQPKPIAPVGIGNPATTNQTTALPPTAPPLPVGDFPDDPYGPGLA